MIADPLYAGGRRLRDPENTADVYAYQGWIDRRHPRNSVSSAQVKSKIADRKNSWYFNGSWQLRGAIHFSQAGTSTGHARDAGGAVVGGGAAVVGQQAAAAPLPPPPVTDVARSLAELEGCLQDRTGTVPGNGQAWKTWGELTSRTDKHGVGQFQFLSADKQLRRSEEIAGALRRQQLTTAQLQIIDALHPSSGPSMAAQFRNRGRDPKQFGGDPDTDAADDPRTWIWGAKVTGHVRASPSQCFIVAARAADKLKGRGAHHWNAVAEGAPTHLVAPGAAQATGTHTYHGLLPPNASLEAGDLLFCNQKINHTVVVFHAPTGPAANPDDVIILSAADDFKFSRSQPRARDTGHELLQGNRTVRAQRGLGVAQFMSLRDFNKMVLLVTMHNLGLVNHSAGGWSHQPTTHLDESLSYIPLRLHRL